MWLRIWNLAVAVLAALALTACEASAPPPDNDSPPPQPALWSVEDPDGAIQGWLFGTIHALPDDVEWRTPALTRAIAASDALVVEISELDDSGELPAIFAELSQSRGLPPLLDRVPPELRGTLAMLLGHAGYDPADLTTTETWAAALALAQAKSYGSTANGVDRALLSEISELRVLEGARAQLSIFDRLRERDQRDLLLSVIKDSRTERQDDYERLVELWRTGDLDGLLRENADGLLADPELREALLTKRNLDWIEKIDRWMKADGPLLVAVGAAHLAGDGGLPQLLADRGYRVKRIQ